MICPTSFTFAQNSDDGIGKVEDLIKNKQFNSAFQLLNEIDPENKNPGIVLKKIDILLNNYIETNLHQEFGLKDLNEGEILEQLRGEQADYINYKFAVNTILEELIRRYPTNWELYKALGEYYFEVYSIYNDQWIKPRNELLELAKKYLLKADQNNVFDAKTLNGLGYIELQKNNPEKSISYYLRLLKLDPNNSDANYYLACAYMQLGKNDESLKFAKTSLELYADKANKAETAKLMVTFYSNKIDSLTAIKYYKVLEDLSPCNYDNVSGLLDLFIKKKDLKSAETAADALFSIDLTPHSLSQIWDIYYQNGLTEELFKFFERTEIKYVSHDGVVGNVLLTKAYFYKLIKDWNQAKHYFQEARKRFEKFYEQDPSKLRFINSMIESAEFEIEYIQFEEKEKTKK